MDQATEVKVIQTDREAAAAWAKANSRHAQAANIRRGSCDAAPIVVAFARHRLASLDSARAEVERADNYPVEERAFHVVVRDRGTPSEVFVVSDRATLSGYPARDRADAYAMAASLNAVVRHHVRRARAALTTETSK